MKIRDYSGIMGSSDTTPSPSSSPMEALIEIMVRLRDPGNGCPWDIKQTFASIAPYTIEEAYEVADAIQRGDMADLKDELGDLLLQVVYHAQIAEELDEFCFDDVAEAIVKKMVRRHPHVFGDQPVGSIDTQKDAWEVQKEGERAVAGNAGNHGTLGGVAKGLPALLRAYKLQKRAARVGFDWPTSDGALEKLREEVDELEAEISTNNDSKNVNLLVDEFGDVLFSAVNLARKLRIDPEAALRRGNEKFERRFRYIEERLSADGKSLKETTLEEFEILWFDAKCKGL